MKISMLASAALVLASGAAAARRPGASVGVLKDRAAMMIYDGRDRVITLVPHADSANMALILLQFEGDLIEPAQLTGRPCIGVALFSKVEWAALASRGRKPADIRPNEAALRLRLYASTAKARAAVQNIATGTARVAIGLDAPEKWSLRTYVENAKGPCTAE